ncbi:MAG TPA: YcfL family protein [Planctomycetota bacterium]|jgi:uncharacterized protein YcfL|nr:YcfL family protein [Planctomycetota bacterium]
MKHLPSLTILLAAIPACATAPVNTVEPVSSEAVGREVWITKINKSSSLEQHLAVQSALVTSSGDSLKVQLQVTNEGEAAKDFRFLFEWFDAEGMKLYEATEGWRRETIEAGQKKSLQATASSPDAVDWRFTAQKWSR